MQNTYTVALCQVDTQTVLGDNLRTAAGLVAQAAARGASLAVFPELFNVIDAVAFPEDIPQGHTITFMSGLARQHGIWILCGSLHERDPEGGKPRNTSVLLDPEGKVAARYSKLHMFDVDLPDGSVARESDTAKAGDAIVVADTPLGRLGMSVCYDLRFPELYRAMALQGAQVMLVPAEFNLYTGQLHWEVLLRARAIENCCYVIAVGQVGTKRTANGPYPCYGNSMVVDPGGNIVARAGQQVGITLAQIDPQQVSLARQKIPVLKNRRNDLY